MHSISDYRPATAELTTGEKPVPEIIERFGAWLELVRGNCASTVHIYCQEIAAALPVLGEDPSNYDAALIHSACRNRLENRSPSQIGQYITAMRMYLRFLVSEACVPASLVAAVPTVPRRCLTSLPRYISTDDVERAIASCAGTVNGVRDRAILLLLARLALRAGDIVALCLCDIDWDRSRVRVSGKFQRQAVLPLPQDVGEALYAYIATARPKVCENRIFLRSRRPYLGFSGPGAVTRIARKALDRAGVKTACTRGAHVFRHSRATELLRSGVRMDTIQWLLRHESTDTTMIYAKTDAVMMMEIAQPWIGGYQP